MKILYKIYTFLRYYPGRSIKNYFTFRGKIPATQKVNKHTKILFCPFAPHRLNIIRESIWAHSLILRGADVKMISYDLFLPAIDFISPGVKKDLKVSYKLSDRIYRLIGLPVTHLSKFESSVDTSNYRVLSKSQIQELECNGVFLGDLVIASTIRYFFCNEPEWDNPLFMEKAIQFGNSAIILTEIFERLLEAEKPDKLVFSHGIYVSWGTLFRVARKMNIPVDIYGASYRKNTLRFYHNAPNAPFPEGEWEQFKNKELLPGELDRVNKYIDSRITESEESVSLFDGKIDLPNNIRLFLQKARNENKSVSCLFGNISWDAYMFRKNSKTFNSMIEWANATIEYYTNNSDSYLIVKSHPAEAYFNIPEKYRLRNSINSKLPSNILVISETDNVNPEVLYHNLDFGLIFTSTVSIEMSLRKIPVLTAGVGGHYSDKGFTIDPASRDEYFNILTKLEAGEYNFDPDIDTAKKYLYFRFFREAIKNNLVTLKKYKVKKYNFTSLNDLLPGKDVELDIICNGILNDTPFINE